MDEKEKAIYSLWGQTKEFEYKISQFLQIAEHGFETMKKPYASLSFGKDSTVMVHLLLSARPWLPVMYVNCGEWDEWPDTSRVKTEFLSRFPCNFLELSGPSIMTSYAKSGFYIQDEEIRPETRAAQREYGNSLGDILDSEAHENGLDGSFIGIRKEESDNRRRLFRMRGTLYYAETRKLWACYPLAFWSARDVWAYIVMYDLPYNELYDLDPQGRELARNGAMMGTRSARYGRLKFLQRMYPDWFNRFAAEFPEVRCYT